MTPFRLRIGPVAWGRKYGTIEYIGERGYYRHWRGRIWLRHIPPAQRRQWETIAWASWRIATALAWWDVRRRGVVAACEAMWRLNRYAKALRGDIGWPFTHADRDAIYAAKARLIRELYMTGEACRVTRAVQRLHCYGCGGSGTWRSYYGHATDRCYRCGGSGVYREIELLLFEFRIRGRVYEWHQPRELVRWESEIHVQQGEPAVYREARAPEDARMRQLRYERDLAAVWRYVDRCGLPLVTLGEWRPRRLGLAQAARDDARHVAYRIRRRGEITMRAVRRLLTRGDDDDDSLPF